MKRVNVAEVTMQRAVSVWWLDQTCSEYQLVFCQENTTIDATEKFHRQYRLITQYLNTL